MPKRSTYLLLIIGLIALATVMPVWLQANTTQLDWSGAVFFGCIFPLLLLYVTIKKTRNWSGITALVMIPYSVLGIMEVVATLGALNAGMAVAIISISNFFAALDAGLRNG
jgi:hypothetical protein